MKQLAICDGTSSSEFGIHMYMATIKVYFHFSFLSLEKRPTNTPSEHLIVLQKKRLLLLITSHHIEVSSSSASHRKLHHKASPLHTITLTIINLAPLNPTWPGQGTHTSQHEKQIAFLQVPMPRSGPLPVDH